MGDRKSLPPGRFLSRVALGAAVAAMLASSACEPSTPPPHSAELLAILVSPNGAEGAAALELSGAGIRSVTAGDPATQVFSTTTGNLTRVLVVRQTPGALTFRVALDDPNRHPTATVLEVADGQNLLRPSVAGYRVEF